MVRSSAKHSLSRVHRLLILVRYLALEGKALRQTQKLRPPWVRSASVQLYTTAMEGVMSKILFGSLVVLLLAFIGLVGCDTMTRDQWGIRIQPVWQR